MSRSNISGYLWCLDAGHVAYGIRNGEFSAREVVTACLGRLEETNPIINALTEVRPEAALEAADASDRAVAKNEELGPLHGVPVTIKGNVDVEGWATVNGCAAFTENIAPAHSSCVQNWLHAGVIILGHTNTPEFCVRWETSNEVFGVTENPWKSGYTPGGSSGGAAASLAVGITPLAQGNDLGGSLRHPAQACGIASIRPSQGRVPNWTATAPPRSIGIQLMEVQGPMARRVSDVRLGLQAMSGRDWHDPWWVPAPLEARNEDKPIVALVVDPAGGGVDQQVALGVKHAGELLGNAGYQVEEIEPPSVSEAADIWRMICIGELLTHLEPAVKDICGPLLLRTLDHYRAALPNFSTENYNNAFAQRENVLRDWLGFMERYQLIVAPVSTEPPLMTDADIESPDATLSVIDSFRMTVAINALGLPAAVVPVGIEDHFPQVVQIIGAPFEEMRCLAAAEAIEMQVEPLTPINPQI